MKQQSFEKSEMRDKNNVIKLCSSAAMPARFKKTATEGARLGLEMKIVTQKKNANFYKFLSLIVGLIWSL